MHSILRCLLRILLALVVGEDANNGKTVGSRLNISGVQRPNISPSVVGVPA